MSSLLRPVGKLLEELLGKQKTDNFDINLLIFFSQECMLVYSFEEARWQIPEGFAFMNPLNFLRRRIVKDNFCALNSLNFGQFSMTSRKLIPALRLTG